MKLLNEIYAYRELLKTNIRKELRGKYKGSVLGVLWSFFNPLLQVLVYAIVFPYLLGNTVDNYLIYLIIGIIPWTFFTTSMNQGMMCIRANAGIVKKVYFPREILPISVVLAGLSNFAISSLIILVFCLFSVGLSWHLILFPVIMILQTLITLGLVLALSAINIYVKDVEYIVIFIINMLFYGTPILYEKSIFDNAPVILKQLIDLNPFSHLIQMYRDVFFYHQIPEMGSLIYVSVIAVILVALGTMIFNKLKIGFAEEV